MQGRSDPLSYGWSLVDGVSSVWDLFVGLVSWTITLAKEELLHHLPILLILQLLICSLLLYLPMTQQPKHLPMLYQSFILVE